MVINKSWSVLTIGDGDLSFSRSIFENYKPKKLTATVLDSELELTQKYGAENLSFLQQASTQQTSEKCTSKQENSFSKNQDLEEDCRECEVITEFDITNLQKLKKLTKCYDLVIFQFPLVPNFANQKQYNQETQNDGLALSINTLNRRLLRMFLIHSFEHLLSENGAQLAYISSKDVKPYIEWDIEYSLTQGTEFTCVGSTPFIIDQFPGYKIRNVDRDKHVKDTASLTYVWTPNRNFDIALNLLPGMDLLPPLFGELGCDICHAGAFQTDQEKVNHLAGKKHQRMQIYDRQWRACLAIENSECSQ